MSSPSSMLFMRRITILSAAVTLALGSACAQFASSPMASSPSASPAAESSSLLFVADEGAAGAASLPDAPSAAASRARQKGKNQFQGQLSHLSFEAGGGFNAPTSDSSPYITWGGNFTAGAGYRFNQYLSLLTEYQILDNKLPGALIKETGARGGFAHIWSFTMAPVIDLFPKHSNDFYVTGGGGFYRKVTSFTDPTWVYYCDFFYCGIGVGNAVVGHFSSNQGGWNVGGGYSRKIAGDYDYGKIKLFAEARYLYVDTPAVQSSPNGLKTTTLAAGTKLVPVTLGIRW
jgi:hypothetical protein